MAGFTPPPRYVTAYSPITVTGAEECAWQAAAYVVDALWVCCRCVCLRAVQVPSPCSVLGRGQRVNAKQTLPEQTKALS